MDFMYLEEEANVHGTCLKWDTTNLFCLTVVMVIPLSVNVLAKQILDWVVCLMTLQCQECSSPSLLQTTSKHPSLKPALSAPAKTRDVVPVTQPWEVCIFSSYIFLYIFLRHISGSHLSWLICTTCTHEQVSKSFLSISWKVESLK